jgi:catechol 2,3-dioxygenase-like lactoylglutathione lyase family enzyme
MILGIHHIALSVPDMRKAIGFYCGVLGFTELWTQDYEGAAAEADAIVGLKAISATVKMLSAGQMSLELWEYRHPRPGPRNPGYSPADHGIAHFCLEVRDIAAEYARLSAAGMRFVGPPVEIDGSSAVYGRDPFGNIIEIYEIAAAVPADRQ